MADILYRPTPPEHHPGTEYCPLSCRGVWRETRDKDQRRGWFWQCDHLRCPVAAADAKASANG